MRGPVYCKFDSRVSPNLWGFERYDMSTKCLATFRKMKQRQTNYGRFSARRERGTRLSEIVPQLRRLKLLLVLGRIDHRTCRIDHRT